MAFSANEQLNLELINRARLDPEAEAERYGINVNDGIDPTASLSTAPMQALAPNDLLQVSADAHSQWMLDNDVFSHTGENGSSSHDRMSDAGYAFTGSWASGENLAFSGNTADIDGITAIYAHHEGLFLSAGHRKNMLNESFREVGVGQQTGNFTQNGTEYNASLLTENYAAAGDRYFITGVVFDDTNGNQFYDVGEGKSGWTISGRTETGWVSTTSASSGGYALKYDAEATEGEVFYYQTEFTRWSVTVHPVSGQNIKLDFLMDGSLLSSNSLTLHENNPASTDLPINHATLLGAVDANLTGNAEHNLLTGSRGDNDLAGGAGNDTLIGGDGIDTAIFNVASTAVSVETSGNGVKITSSEGTDVIYSVERYQFTDGTFSQTQVEVLNATQEPEEIVRDLDEVTVGEETNDTFTGTDVNDGIYGRGGDDTIFGMGGHDNIAGADGNDLIDGGDGYDNIGGGLGDDTIDGGTGNDTIGSGQGNDVVNAGDGDDLVAAGSGDDTIDGSSGNDRLAGSVGADSITGGLGNDNIGGGYHSDTIYAGDGNDTVGAGQQDDVLNGGAGDDVLNGNAGHDTIEGGAGNDTLSGGDHNDVMTGGTGADVFYFRVFSAGTEDIITDFTRGEDRLEMRGNFAGLSITDHVDGIQVEKNGHVIVLEGLEVLTADDFYFV